jgi:hypothetical protein
VQLGDMSPITFQVCWGITTTQAARTWKRRGTCTRADLIHRIPHMYLAPLDLRKCYTLTD